MRQDSSGLSAPRPSPQPRPVEGAAQQLPLGLLGQAVAGPVVAPAARDGARQGGEKHLRVLAGRAERVQVGRDQRDALRLGQVRAAVGAQRRGDDGVGAPAGRLAVVHQPRDDRADLAEKGAQGAQRVARAVQKRRDQRRVEQLADPADQRLEADAVLRGQRRVVGGRRDRDGDPGGASPSARATNGWTSPREPTARMVMRLIGRPAARPAAAWPPAAPAAARR